MDFDKLMEKALRWFSDPRSREVVKSILYVLFPLIVISLLRNIKRSQSARKQVTAVTPRVRGSSTESLVVTETLQETMAKENKKVQRELQEVFGRRERMLTKSRTRTAVPTGVSPQTQGSESSGSGDEQPTREDLIRVLLGRKRE